MTNVSSLGHLSLRVYWRSLQERSVSFSPWHVGPRATVFLPLYWRGILDETGKHCIVDGLFVLTCARKCPCSDVDAAQPETDEIHNREASL